jgi:hypothetical protein
MQSVFVRTRQSARVLAALLTLRFSQQVNHLLSVLNIAALFSVLHFCYLLVLLIKISVV